MSNILICHSPAELPAPEVKDPNKKVLVLTGPDDPYFELAPDVALRLTAYRNSTQLEFSGVGFIRKEGKKLYVYDFVLLNVGSYGYTEIPPEKVAMLAATRQDAANMRLWIHRHPLGNSTPGSHNWSGTDNATCEQEPLGSPAELTTWAAAIVLTPTGWVGRLDSFQGGLVTRHLRVLPDLAQFKAEIEKLRPVTNIFKEKVSRPKDESGAAGTNLYLPNWSEPRYSTPEPHRYSDEHGNFTVPAPRGYEEEDYRQGALLDASTYTDDGFFLDGYEEDLLFDIIDQFGPSATLGDVAEACGYEVVSNEPTERVPEMRERFEPKTPVFSLKNFFGLGRKG